MLLTPSKIHIENFRLIVHAEVPLNNLGLVYLGAVNKDVRGASSNMGGKSTFVNALTWCTHGCDVNGNMLADDVIHFGAKQTIVQVEFIKPDGGRMWISRKRTKSPATTQASIRHNAISIPAKQGPVQEMQPTINAMLGTKDLFLAAHFFGYDERTDPFALRSDKEQKSLFNILINADDLDGAYVRASLKRKEHQLSLQKLTTKVSSITATINTLQTAIGSLEQSFTETSKESREKTALSARAVAEAKKALDTARAHCVTADKLVAVTEHKVNTIKDVMQVAEAEYVNHSANLEGELHDLSVEEAAIEQLVRTGKCPTCKSKFHGTTHKHMLHKIRTGMVALTAQKKAITEKYHKEKAERSARFRMLQEEAASARHVEDNARNAERSAMMALERATATHKADLQALTTATADQKSRVAVFKKRLHEARRKHLAYSIRVKRKERKIKALVFWLTGFGDRGIRAYRLDLVTPRLNGYARKYSDILFGDGSRVVYSTQKLNKGGGYAEKFDVSIVDTAGKPLTCLSAGQALRRDIIHTFSVAALAESLGKRTMDLLVFDEAFRTLDAKGIEEAIKLLRFTAKRTGTIIVAEHSEELRARFPRHLMVERSGGKSSVMLE